VAAVALMCRASAGPCFCSNSPPSASPGSFACRTASVWTDSGKKSDNAEVEITFAAAGLYAVLFIGARGEGGPADIARVAHALLPDWMRRPELR